MMNRNPANQAGVTLVELMVGLAVGLLVVAAATVGLLASRGLSGTVSDASGIQQQAAYALRVIGLQLREASSLYLNPNVSGSSTADDPFAPVGFEIHASNGGNVFDLNTTEQIVQETNGKLTVGFARYKVPVHTEAAAQALARNCVGGPTNDSLDARVESIFEFNAGTAQLRCGGNGAASQPIVDHVASFQTRYLVQDNSAPGNPKIRYAKAGDVTNWRAVQAVEICLVLHGNEPIGMPAGSSYSDCDGQAVDMTALDGERRNRMHLVFRNVFQIRSQGLSDAPL